MFDRFTERSREVMSLARQEAQRLHSEFIGPEHILLGILQEGSGTAARTLSRMSIDLKRIHLELELLFTPRAESDSLLGQLPFSPPCKRVIEEAGSAATKLRHDVIGTEHLLLGLMRERRSGAARVLSNLGLRLEEVERTIVELLGQAQTPAPQKQGALSRWAGSYRALADRPALQARIAELLQQGRSLALVGPPNVGKTSLVMALGRSKAGGLTYESVDYRRFDPLQPRERLDWGRPGTVTLIPESEIVSASRSEAVKSLARCKMEGEQLIFEFREGGLEAFAARYPNFAKSLETVTVAAPDAAECRDILESARRRLKDEAGLQVSEEVLAELDRLARATWPALIPPWQSLVTLWKAEAIHRETEDRGDLAQLEKDIEALEKSGEAAKQEEAKLLGMHLEGLRGMRKSGLSIEAVRRAIGELSGQSASEPR